MIDNYLKKYMSKITIVNLKCGGCEKSITEALEKNGFENIKVDVISREVSFDGDKKKAEKILANLGYPRQGSAEAKKLSKKAKSLLSCFMGKMKK